MRKYEMATTDLSLRGMIYKNDFDGDYMHPPRLIAIGWYTILWTMSLGSCSTLN
jgi:hypothetical protein